MSLLIGRHCRGAILAPKGSMGLTGLHAQFGHGTTAVQWRHLARAGHRLSPPGRLGNRRCCDRQHLLSPRPFNGSLRAKSAASSSPPDPTPPPKSSPPSPSTPSSPIDKARSLLPGVGVAGGLSAVATVGAKAAGPALLALQGVAASGPSPLSPIPVAILLGLAVNNTTSLPETLRPGLKFASTTILRAGVVCVGAKLSALDLMSTGAVTLPMIAANVAVTLAFATWLGGRVGLPPRMSALIAAGTSICGVTAIMALAPIIKATSKETTFAVANVVAFGTLGLLCYPYLAHQLFDSSHQVGLFLGLAVHDTSQVLGSAMTYSQVFSDELVLRVATITKLTRNVLLAAAIPLLAMPLVGKDAAASAAGGVGKNLSKFLPLFVVGFVAMTVVRSIGDATLQSSGAALFLVDPNTWSWLISLVGGSVPTVCLGTAMAAVGLSTSAGSLRGVGPMPFVVGLSAALMAAACGFLMASALPMVLPDQPRREETGNEAS